MIGRRVPWEEFFSACEKLADQIANQDHKGRLELVGVLRGGAIVASVVSYRLSQKYAMDSLVTTIGLRKYDDEGKPDKLAGGKPRVYAWPSSMVLPPGSLTVVVDEIAATGETMRFAQSMISAQRERVLSACLYATKSVLCDLCVELVSPDVWLSFPWDTDEEGP